jgi:predicted solute-binding protein
MAPDLGTMLARADAALIIGDPALHLAPEQLPYRVFDLGEEWMKLSGLPMVFAVWAGKASFLTEAIRRTFVESYRFGLDHLDEIVDSAPSAHGVPVELARRYLTRHIVFELNEHDRRGLARFLEWAAEIDPLLRYSFRQVC